MAFAVTNADLITQTGTDTNLSGLNGLAGVTREQHGSSSIYQFSVYIVSRKLRVAGTLSFDASREMIVFTGSSRSDILLVDSDGTMTVQASKTLNSFTTNRPQRAIVFALSTQTIWNRQDFRVTGSGIFRMYNCGIVGSISPWFECNSSGEVLMEDFFIDKEGASGDVQTNLAGDSTRYTFRRGEMYVNGQSGVTFRDNNGVPNIESVAIFQARDGWNNESNQQVIINGLVPEVGSLVDVAQWNGQNTKVVNAVKGVEFLWGGHLTNNGGNRGQVTIYQELSAKVTDADGNNVNNAKLYLADNPVQGNSGHTVDGTAANIARTYTRTSNSSGEIASFEVLIGEGRRVSGGVQISTAAADQIKPRGISTTSSTRATDDLYTYSFISYVHNINTANVVLKGGTSAETVNVQPIMVVDSSVTQTTKATVDAYTTLETSAKLYDRAKSFLFDNYAGETTAMFSRTGTTLDAGALNVKLATDYDSTESYVIGDVAYQNSRIYECTTATTGTFDAADWTEIVNGVFHRSATTIFAYYGTGQFTGSITTTGTVTIKDKADVTGNIFDSTQDSSLVERSGFTFKVYATAANRDARTNPIVSDVTRWSFLFSGLSGTTVYLWVTVGAIEVPSQITLVQGANEIDAGTAGQLLLVRTTTDKLDTTLEQDGNVYRYTTNALEQAPSGGGVGTADWTSGEKEQIRSALGVDGTKTTATGGQLQNKSEFNASSDTVTTDSASRTASQADVSSLSTFDPSSDTVARVTLVDTTTTNTDMRGTDNANTTTPPTVTEIYTEFTRDSNEDAFKATGFSTFDASSDTVTTDSESRTASQADVSGLATATNLQTVDDNVDAIKTETDKLNNMIEADGSDFRFKANALEQGGGTSPADIYTYFTDGTREDAFKASTTDAEAAKTAAEANNKLLLADERIRPNRYQLLDKDDNTQVLKDKTVTINGDNNLDITDA